MNEKKLYLSEDWDRIYIHLIFNHRESKEDLACRYFIVIRKMSTENTIYIQQIFMYIEEEKKNKRLSNRLNTSE